MTESEKRRDAVMRYLSRPRECDRIIRRKKERIRDLRSSLSLQSPALTDMPNNPSPPASKMEETLVKIFSLEEEIALGEKRKAAIQREMRNDIMKIPDERQQVVINAMYIVGLRWNDALNMTGMSRRTMSDARREAIDRLSDILDEEGRLKDYEDEDGRWQYDERGTDAG